ncbi:MAG: hypothetical protein B6I20_04120 [Bacteroidetes bacterium 4572_117]|nr:MAG: hypothetical protein B6I20_04120 [Bacteroidetes bacterium 4572_117]
MVKKILLSLLAVLILAIIILSFWLFNDNAFPDFNESSLIKTDNSEIQGATISKLQNDSLKKIIVDGEWFKDQTGRVMILRGINLGGSTKVPIDMPSYKRENFFDAAKTVSFVGRPFPIEEADEHFKRLKAWGFHFLRFLVTWEAIEHEGPGIYDEQYIEYVYQIIKKANEYNINVFIDPHQDVWSRFSGGDGAPKWTLDIVGLDVSKFKETGAAIVHNTHGDPFPKMVWGTNYSKFAAATMFSLFFAGNNLAPEVFVNDSIPVQDFLQNHYINAIAKLATKLKNLPNVIGYDTKNEPSVGFIGHKNLEKTGFYTLGETVSPLQAMALAYGITQKVPFYEVGLTGAKKTKETTVNPKNRSVWLAGFNPIWKQHGVWDIDETGKPFVVKKDYFTIHKGKKINFAENYFKPFVQKYAQAIQKIDNELVVFVESATSSVLPDLKNDGFKYVDAVHWYDFLTLVTKSYYSFVSLDISTGELILSKKNVRKAFEKQLAAKKEDTRKHLGNCPTLIGEFGIPFDMSEKKAYKNGDFSEQTAAIDRSFNAIEANLLNYTLWNYTSDNTNARGDLWNDEDLSIFSVDQQTDKTDINSGGRALDAVVRPYPYKISGTPLHYHFNYKEKEFVLKFNNDTSLNGPTEVFLPDYHYKGGFEVYHTKGVLKWDKENCMLLFYPDKKVKKHKIIVRK